MRRSRKVGIMKRLISFFCMIIFGGLLAGCGKEKPVIITEGNVTEETLIVEGLEQDYEFLFLTDTHMVVSDSEDSEQIAANGAERGPQFVDGEGVSSAVQFPAWMNYAVEQQMDAVLFGGDIIDYPSQGNLNYLQDNLAVLSMPYLYTLGNHDWTYPWEYMTEIGETEYLPLLEPMMQGNTVIQRIDVGELTVVAVDNSSGQVNGEALQIYQEILAEGRPTIVVVHVPFLTQSVLTKAREAWTSPVVIGGGNFGGIYPNEASTTFVEMTTAEDSPVVAVLSGHVHFFDKDVIDGEKDVIQIVGDAGFRRQGIKLMISGEAK